MWQYDRDYLAHHGIKGQQWGIRRFQNEDGTLTAIGRERYGIDERYSEGRTESDAKTKTKEQGSLPTVKKFSVGDMAAIKVRYNENKQKDDPIRKQLAKEKQEHKDIGDRRRALEKKFLEKGYTQEQAEIRAYKQQRIETALKIAAGVAVAAAVTYGAIKGKQLISRYGDKMIKSGTQLQRITDSPTEDLTRNVFVSPNKSDWVKYEGGFGRLINDKHEQIKLSNKFANLRGESPVPVNDSIYKLVGHTDEKIKIAGERKGRQIFNKLMKNDAEFKKDFENSIKNQGIGIVRGKTYDYDTFNQLLGQHSNEGVVRAREKFYKALKEKGYGGLIDINDRRVSGYRSKDPTILFDFGKKVKGIKITALDSNDIHNAYGKAVRAMNRDYLKEVKVNEISSNFGKFAVKTGAFAGADAGAIALGGAVSNRRASQYRSLINQYKSEHPNTKLTDDQILENLLG